jgi:hypothetical protein
MSNTHEKAQAYGFRSADVLRALDASGVPTFAVGATPVEERSGAATSTPCREEFLLGILAELRGIRQEIQRIEQKRRAAVRRLLYGA